MLVSTDTIAVVAHAVVNKATLPTADDDDLPQYFCVCELTHEIICKESPYGDVVGPSMTTLVESIFALKDFVPDVDPKRPNRISRNPFFPNEPPGNEIPDSPTTSFVVAVIQPVKLLEIAVFVLGSFGIPDV